MTDVSFRSIRLPAISAGFDQFQQLAWQDRGDQAFWLRQQLRKRPLAAPVSEVVMVVFQRKPIETALVLDQDALSGRSVPGDWQAQQQNLASGSFWRDEGGQLSARLFTPQGSAHWAWQRRLQRQPGLQLQGPFDQLQAQSASYEGEATVAGQPVAGYFQGLVARYSGRWHTPGFVQVFARHFAGGDEVRFAACGHALGSRWQVREPLSLSQACLQIGQTVHVFDRWLPGLTVDAPRLDNYRWQAVLVNHSHRLQIVVDGGNPRLQPWAALNESLPMGRRRVLKMTPFATLELTLFRRGSQQPEACFQSRQAWLATALPDSRVSSRGPVGLP